LGDASTIFSAQCTPVRTSGGLAQSKPLI